MKGNVLERRGKIGRKKERISTSDHLLDLFLLRLKSQCLHGNLEFFGVDLARTVCVEEVEGLFDLLSLFFGERALSLLDWLLDHFNYDLVLPAGYSNRIRLIRPSLIIGLSSELTFLRLFAKVWVFLDQNCEE